MQINVFVNINIQFQVIMVWLKVKHRFDKINYSYNNR
jgi:hypothetical protein